ncbi:hypothetical protein GmHk_10G028397 [Glycine max]|nr:hypothetical protein GmHk_10G028397 [Glycine max]KAH1228402.1 hypothetical protein GmHk_10G028397 [Glycine max]
MACAPWLMFVDYVKETWIIPHKEKFVSAWTNKIVAELERVDYAGKNPSSCGCMVRTMLGLPCVCELSKYVGGCIPLNSIHMFWRRLSFSDQGLSEPKVSIKVEIETISKIFEELDVCGKFTLKTKLWEIVYPDQNSMCPPPAKVNTKGAPKKPMSRNPSASSSEQPNQRTMMSMLDQFQSFMHDFIDKIVDVKADDYIKLFGGTERFAELRISLLVDGLTKVTTDKWMNITDIGYVIASRIELTLFLHVQHVYLKERCPLSPVALLWSSNCHPQAKLWPNPYISKMQHYKSFVMFKRDYVDINDD